MHFLPDVYVPCEVCKGKRYNAQTLEVKYKGKTISDVLEMRVDEANEFFASIPRVHNKLRTICDVGLGYIKMGQPATTLSGGEAQRVKLADGLSGARPAARFTCSTNRRPDCTSPIFISSRSARTFGQTGQYRARDRA